MSWRELIAPSTSVWAGVVGYANERIVSLTEVCTAQESTDTAIRSAQAGINELQRLIALPRLITAETQMRASTGTRKDY